MVPCEDYGLTSDYPTTTRRIMTCIFHLCLLRPYRILLPSLPRLSWRNSLQREATTRGDLGLSILVGCQVSFPLAALWQENKTTLYYTLLYSTLPCYTLPSNCDKGLEGRAPEAGLMEKRLLGGSWAVKNGIKLGSRTTVAATLFEILVDLLVTTQRPPSNGAPCPTPGPETQRTCRTCAVKVEPSSTPRSPSVAV